MMHDCLALRFIPGSLCEEGVISLSFWVRMGWGGSILTTAFLTESKYGPGIEIRYNPDREILSVRFQKDAYYWEVQQQLPKHAWCHVFISWNATSGLRVVIDGNLTNMAQGKQRDHPFSKRQDER